MSKLLTKLNYYLNDLPVKLQNHLHRTAKLGRELSLLHEVNDEKVFVGYEDVSPFEEKLTPMPTPISIVIMLNCRFKYLKERIESNKKGMCSYLL